MNLFNSGPVDRIIQAMVTTMKSYLQAMVIFAAVWWTIGLSFTLFNPGRPSNVIGWLFPILITPIGLLTIIFTGSVIAAVVASITFIGQLFPKQWQVFIYVPDVNHTIGQYITYLGKVWSIEPSQALAEKMLAKAKQTKFTPAMHHEVGWVVEFSVFDDSLRDLRKLKFIVGEMQSDDFDLDDYTDEDVALDHHADMMLLQENTYEGRYRYSDGSWSTSDAESKALGEATRRKRREMDDEK